MGGNEFITFALVVTGLVIICALYADFMTRRAYGLLALTLLAIVALGYLWPPALSTYAQLGSWEHTPDSVVIAIVEVVYIAGTVLAIALLGIVGLIEMAATRRWRWLAGLLAAMALMVAAILLPFFYRSLPYNLQNLPVLFFSPPNYPILLGWLWLVCEAVVLLVCAGFGVRATWFRSQPAARA